MDKQLELIKQILSSTMSLHKSVNTYLNIPRTYGNDVPLYMRETHFIAALGDAGKMLDAEELAQKLGITHGAVTQLTDRLEKKGYIYRTKNPDNKRKILRGLTEKGSDIYNLHLLFDENAYNLIKNRCNDFSTEELETFIRVSERIASCFSDETSKREDMKHDDPRLQRVISE